MEGLWKYSSYFSTKIQDHSKLSLGEGDTPFYKSEGLSKLLNTNVYLKREDQNPTGSHKDRNNAVQISNALQNNIKKLVLSSSGNNAISAIPYVSLTDMQLVVYVPEGLQLEKEERLKKVYALSKKENITIVHSKHPKRDAFRYAKENNALNLQPSKDPLALMGQSTLGIEISQILNQNPIEAIFMPVSSGTGLLGISEGFNLTHTKLPVLNAVQTSKIHPIAMIYDRNFKYESISLAKAIVARSTDRKDPLIKAINESSGNSWVIENDDLYFAMEMINNAKENRFSDLSYDSALSLAGFIKARANGLNYNNVLCVFTGK